jgi:hypothetical protein
MSNREHVAVVNEGIPAWNRWRRENGIERPGLKDLTLNKRDLQGVDFRNVDLCLSRKPLESIPAWRQILPDHRRRLQSLVLAAEAFP